jgi:hypothetical protein
LVQVTPDAQLGAGLQLWQVSGGPDTLYLPATQPSHCELPAPEQVRPDEQPVIVVHAVHTRLVVTLQAVLS